MLHHPCPFPAIDAEITRHGGHASATGTTRYLAVIILIAITTVLQGCAFTTERIALKYVPQANVQALPAATGQFVNVSVSDSRPDKRKVSSKKNGFGMETADILATEDVALTIRNALEQELAHRGFKLNADATVQIAAEVGRFYNNFAVGLVSADASAELQLAVTVRDKPGAVLYSQQILAKGSEKSVLMMTGENAEIALSRALQEGIAQLFSDQKFIDALTASGG